MPDNAPIELVVERPAAGGRMIARHDGRIVFVAGAIPGERVKAQVERTARGVIWARTIEVLDASDARRAVGADPACGGLDFLHIAYDRQCALKAQIVTDAFRHIGKMQIEAAPAAPSPEHGFRLRTRLHLQQGRAGFFKEGTHTWCDPRPGRQLSDATCAAIDDVLAALSAQRDAWAEIVVSENVKGSERIVHLVERSDGQAADVTSLELPAGVIGLSAGSGRQRQTLGAERLSDTAADLFGSESPIPAATRWLRGPRSFFQGNRFLTGALVRHVLESAHGDRVLDLYAGVGLFAVALAAGGCQVVAVEGDPESAADLQVNADAVGERLRAVHAAVEDVSASGGGRFDAVIVDPPRAGLSPRALERVRAVRAGRVVYVSCDPATLARDAAHLAAAGYRLDRVQVLDLFPNTAHVETVVVLTRRAEAGLP
jgi:23S rRNA (uracil1939-C5)-methyltransferase